MRANLLIVVGCLSASLAGRPQGTVYFANLGPGGLNSPVIIGPAGERAGSSWMAQLLLVGTGGSTTAIGAPANFVGDGYFNGGVITVNQVTPGALGTFQGFFWDSTSGALTYAAALAAWNAGAIRAMFSSQVTVTTGGFGVPASTPASLPLVWPTGSSLRFNNPTVAGGQLNLSWTGTATLQQASSLTGSVNDWSDVQGVTGNSYSVAVGTTGNKFYRLKQ